jgi:hypothetical protein
MVVFRCPKFATEFQSTNRFPAAKQGICILESEAEKKTYLHELDAKKSLVESDKQRREEQTQYNHWFRIWPFQTPALKAVCSNAAAG